MRESLARRGQPRGETAHLRGSNHQVHRHQRVRGRARVRERQLVAQQPPREDELQRARPLGPLAFLCGARPSSATSADAAAHSRQPRACLRPVPNQRLLDDAHGRAQRERQRSNVCPVIQAEAQRRCFLRGLRHADVRETRKQAADCRGGASRPSQHQRGRTRALRSRRRNTAVAISARPRRRPARARRTGACAPRGAWRLVCCAAATRSSAPRVLAARRPGTGAGGGAEVFAVRYTLRASAAANESVAPGQRARRRGRGEKGADPELTSARGQPLVSPAPAPRWAASRCKRRCGHRQLLRGCARGRRLLSRAALSVCRSAVPRRARGSVGSRRRAARASRPQQPPGVARAFWSPPQTCAPGRSRLRPRRTHSSRPSVLTRAPRCRGKWRTGSRWTRRGPRRRACLSRCRRCRRRRRWRAAARATP